MSEIPTAPADRPRRRWVTIALIVSLSLNLLVVGMIGGLALNRAGPPRESHDRPPGSSELMSAGPLARALTTEERRALARELFKNRDQLRAARRQLQGGLEQAVAVLQADQFDRAALAAVMQQQNTILVEQVGDMQELLLDHLEGLDPAQRAEMAERLNDVLHRGRPQRQ